MEQVATELPVAIIGAGVAGLVLAIRLRQVGRRVQVFEARAEKANNEGAFLTLAPNGINALKALGLAERIVARGIPTLGIEILNATGKRLALIDERELQRETEAASVTLPRAALLNELLAAAKRAGAEICFDHALKDLQREGAGVLLRFATGAVARAAWVAGCDGVWSRTRRLAFPEAPSPVYAGLTGTGGFIDLPTVAPTGGFMRMVFGEHAFFGYIKAEHGPVFWFDSFPLAEKDAVARPDPQALAALTRRLHANAPEPIGRIAASIAHVPRGYPIYDMTHLPRWHDEHVVLAGDAAHAVSPHAGQGASMAIEDAVVLAACLSRNTTHSAAFANYQALRRDRAEHVVRISRQRGAQKQAKGRFSLFLRDLVLPWVVPLGVRTAQSVMRYRADRDPLVKPTH
jgi:2-polyprenyl-6-methoxyphenol hydroxylase-like FAD-dependent oxidoreductase